MATASYRKLDMAAASYSRLHGYSELQQVAWLQRVTAGYMAAASYSKLHGYSELQEVEWLQRVTAGSMATASYRKLHMAAASYIADAS